ncbi:MAG: sigma-70 family RNA polymerase sigma factor [Lachnospiraceae bacterium]|nr:sigma-70 family RNA polymerase sigma factor [Lachnospiraceae bacterium]MBR5788998.1 sigma-70 family RNA polymerase sigma factor [Lachnospiraceae bacterium]
MTDEEMVKLAQSGDTESMNSLMEKYKVTVRKKANTLFLIGGDTEDLIQEGMIGLFTAINTYDISKNASFKTFANMCIAGQMNHAIEAANRFKHGPLNSYISYDIKLTEDDDESLLDVIEDIEEHEPENQYIDKENVRNMLIKIKDTLSPLEWDVFLLHVNGTNYREIADKLNKSEKSIDNALNRIKQKVTKLNEDEDDK